MMERKGLVVPHYNRLLSSREVGQLGLLFLGDVAPLGRRTPSGVMFGFPPLAFHLRVKGTFEKVQSSAKYY